MNKPKLLITMGCSLTEGEGCYDINTLPNDIDINRNTFTDLYVDLTQEIKNKNYQRFHENGWPNRLGRKLNYNRVINLGFGGASTSGQLKVFMEKYYNEYFIDYDVCLIWYLSESSRISFYQDGEVRNIQNSTSSHKSLYNEYIKLIDINYDTILEQLFYVRIMNEICSNRNWNFLVQHHDLPLGQRLRQYDSNHEYYLNQDNINIDDMISSNLDYYVSPICSHPNENGYELISSIIYQQIKKYYPHLINQNKVENFTWEWNGEPKKWEKVILDA
jgi:hypothetical protein